ncbi:MAG TPA: hypothetical protein PLK31_24270, partial [Chloroflexota bacterium]|nr:hypothetical protein [Chloroflexota bacterium]
GVKLMFNCLDTATGSETIFTYPGAETPLLEALTAAATLPGLMPPLSGDGVHSEQWVDGTLVNSFMIQTVLRQQPMAELWAVAAAVPQPDLAQPPKQYAHWRAIASRALQLNQSQDVRLGLLFAQQFTTAVAAHQQVSRRLTEQLAELITDPEIKSHLKHELGKLYQPSAFPFKDACPTAVHCLTPSQDLDYPLWRFRHKDLAFTQTLGYRDAQAYTAEGNLNP